MFKPSKKTIKKYRADTEAKKAYRHAFEDQHGYQFCEQCGRNNVLEVHHKVFKSHGGTNDFSNLILLCMVCHGKSHHQNKILYDFSTTKK